MPTLSLDTHAFIKKLTKARMPERQAEALAREQLHLLENRLATKNDLNKLETDFHGEITILGNVLRAEISTRVAEVKAKLIKWMFGISAGQAAFILSIISILKIFH